jgi:DNA-binding beta-propeller fold protein YncE
MNRSVVLGVLAFSLCISQALAADAYKVLGEYRLQGGAAKGIGIDPSGRRLFVASGDRVEVLNADTGAAMGIISQTDAQEVLLVNDSRRGFASGNGSITMFDTEILKVLRVTSLQASGGGSMCYSNYRNAVYVISSKSGDISAVDAKSGELLRTASLEPGLGQIACGSFDYLFVASPEKNVVHVVSARTLAVLGDYPMKSGERPTGMALDTVGRRLFVACANGWDEIIDTDAGFIFQEIEIGKGPARSAFAMLPQGMGGWRGAAFVASDDGTFSLIRMNAFVDYSLGGKVTLPTSVHSVALDEKSHRLFVTAKRQGKPVVLVLGAEGV